MKAAIYILAGLVLVVFAVGFSGSNEWVGSTFSGESETTLVHSVAPQLGISQYSTAE